MITVSITIIKKSVYLEVEKTTSYAGRKAIGEDVAVAMDRIASTESDRTMLERYWNEACAMATECMRQFLSSVTMSPSLTTSPGAVDNLSDDDDYSVTLSMPASYDRTLNDGLAASLYSFFVNYIVSKWYMAAAKSDVTAYTTEAAAMLLDVRTKLYYRKAPTRVAPNKGSVVTDKGSVVIHGATDE